MKKLIVLLTVIMMVCVLTVTAYASEQLTVTPCQDAYVRNDKPDESFNEAIINLRYKPQEGKNRNAFLEFDVKGLAGATVESVKLVLTSAKIGGNTTFDVHLVTDAWNETGVTWNAAPKYGEKLGSYTDSSDLMSDQEVVVELKKDFIKGDGKYSLALISSGPTDKDNDDTEFYSREGNANKAPKLVITYSGGSGTSQGEGSATSQDSENPKTGDFYTMTPFIVMLIITGLLIPVIIRKVRLSSK